MRPDYEKVQIVQTIVLSISFIFAAIYLIITIFLTHLHPRSHLLIWNLCLAAISCSTYWIIANVAYFIRPQTFFEEKSCPYWGYFRMFFTFQYPLATVTVSIDRYFSIVYRKKRIFRTKRWIISSAIVQWIIGIVLTTPKLFFFVDKFCHQQRKIYVYEFFCVVFIPAVITLLINLLIFKHIHSSTKRIQPTTSSHSNSSRSRLPLGRILSRRDSRVLRQIILIFTIFLIGWSPIFIYQIIVIQIFRYPLLCALLLLLADCTLLIGVINIYFYDHDLHRYLRDRFHKLTKT